MKYLLILSIFISFYGTSQQEPLSGMSWNNYSYFNPAMSGVNHKNEGNVSYRSQWNKVTNAPSTLIGKLRDEPI